MSSDGKGLRRCPAASSVKGASADNNGLGLYGIAERNKTTGSSQWRTQKGATLARTFGTRPFFFCKAYAYLTFLSFLLALGGTVYFIGLRRPEQVLET